MLKGNLEGHLTRWQWMLIWTLPPLWYREEHKEHVWSFTSHSVNNVQTMCYLHAKPSFPQVPQIGLGMLYLHRVMRCLFVFTPSLQQGLLFVDLSPCGGLLSAAVLHLNWHSHRATLLWIRRRNRTHQCPFRLTPKAEVGYCCIVVDTVTTLKVSILL